MVLINRFKGILLWIITLREMAIWVSPFLGEFSPIDSISGSSYCRRKWACWAVQCHFSLFDQEIVYSRSPINHGSNTKLVIDLARNLSILHSPKTSVNIALVTDMTETKCHTWCTLLEFQSRQGIRSLNHKKFWTLSINNNFFDSAANESNESEDFQGFQCCSLRVFVIKSFWRWCIPSFAPQPLELMILPWWMTFDARGNVSLNLHCSMPSQLNVCSKLWNLMSTASTHSQRHCMPSQEVIRKAPAPGRSRAFESHEHGWLELWINSTMLIRIAWKAGWV